MRGNPVLGKSCANHKHQS